MSLQRANRARSRGKRARCSLVIEALETRRVLAAAPFLVSDIELAPASSSPGQVAVMGDHFFFAADGGFLGRELWVSDGTEAGTELVKDINLNAASSSPSDLVVIGDVLFFTADDGIHGRELWKSDGTEAGTVMVKDIVSGSSTSSPEKLMNFNGQLIFSAYSSGLGVELWTSDGTAEGTVVVADIYPGSSYSYPQGFVEFDGELYFSAVASGTGRELWKTDGTTLGTSLVKDVYPGSTSSSPAQLIVMGNQLYFAATTPDEGTELWTSDGTEAGTMLLADIRLGANSSFPSALTPAGDHFFFTAFTDAAGGELWMSDGTEEGTVQVIDINSGSYSASPTNLTMAGDNLYFVALQSGTGRELWKSDGTLAGTSVVLDIYPGSNSSDPSTFMNVSGELFFTAITSTSNRELWKSDGTAEGTVMVADIRPGAGASSPQNLQSFATALIFSATTDESGTELWISNGTEAGTMQLKDINTNTLDASPGELYSDAGTLYFSARDGVDSYELWKSDGSNESTVQVADIYPGNYASTPASFTKVGSTLFFTALKNGVGRELWKTDGTAEGTVLVKDIYVGSGSSSPTELVAFNGRLYFSAYGSQGTELWTSDGTDAGTFQVIDINFGGNSSPQNLTVVDNTLFFTATTVGEGREWWTSDGTMEGTVMVKDIRPGGTGSFTGAAVALDGKLYFSANDGISGDELWVSDGTAEGTMQLADISPGTSASTPRELTSVGDRFYFSAYTAALGRELWMSDGTTAGTELVTNLSPSGTNSTPQSLLEWNGLLYFTADVSQGRELWVSDGTVLGTNQVKDINPGSGSSDPLELMVVRGQLFFSAIDPDFGRELWTSDGSAGGTMLYADIRAGSGSSSPAGLTDVNGMLYFVANDGLHGTEVWGALVGDAPINLYPIPQYVVENVTIGSDVASLRTVDPTAGDTFTYTFVAGDGDEDNASFSISGDQLIAATSVDFEMKNTYSLRVRSTDLGGDFVDKQLLIRVSDTNDGPAMSSVSTLHTAGINASFTVTYDELLASSDAFDQDNDPLFFVVQSELDGGLTKDGQPVVPGETTLGAGESWVWTPSLDNLGVLPAFSVVVSDGELDSGTPVSVSIEVTPWTLFMEIANDELSEADELVASTMVISRVGDLSEALIVTLSNSDNTEIELPLTVTIPAGQGSVTVDVKIINDGEVDGDQTAGILASADAYVSASELISVVDDDTPELRTIGGSLYGTLAVDSYTVLQDVGVLANETLVIEPASQLLFNAGKSLTVPQSATLIAEGTEADQIVFTSASAEPAPGDWTGITIASLTGARSILDHVEIAYATTAISNYSYSRALFDLTNSEVHHASAHGVYLRVGYGSYLGPTDVRVIGNRIHDIGQYGITILAYGISGNPPRSSNNQAYIEGNEIFNTDTAIYAVAVYSAAGGFVGSASVSPTVVSNYVHQNRIGVSGEAYKPSSAFGSSWIAGSYSNNVVVNNSSHGFYITRSSGFIGVNIANNTIAGNGEAGIYHDVLQSSGSIRNNNVVGNAVGIQNSVTSAPIAGQVANNNVQGNTEFNWRNYPDSFGDITTTNGNGTPSDSELNISEVPQFASIVTSDYRLLVSSPLIDAGTVTGAPATDFDGVSRDLNPDIGAFEKYSLPPTSVQLVSNQVNENAVANSVVSSLMTIDPDEGDVHEYSLVSGDGDSDNGKFVIVGNELMVIGTLDFETSPVYSIRVRSTDLQGLWIEEAISIDVADLPEVESIQVGDGTEQRSFVNQVVVTFDGEVTFDVGAIAVIKRGVGGGIVTTDVATAVNGLGQTVATITFSGAQTRGALGALQDGSYQLNIDGAKVHRGAVHLDGDQDGIDGGDFAYGTESSDEFFALFGDLNGDRMIGLAEFNAFRNAFGRADDDPLYREELDFDGNGSVSLSDFNQFRSRFGRTLAFE